MEKGYCLFRGELHSVAPRGFFFFFFLNTIWLCYVVFCVCVGGAVETGVRRVPPCVSITSSCHHHHHHRHRFITLTSHDSRIITVHPSIGYTSSCIIPHHHVICLVYSEKRNKAFLTNAFILQGVSWANSKSVWK